MPSDAKIIPFPGAASPAADDPDFLLVQRRQRQGMSVEILDLDDLPPEMQDLILDILGPEPEPDD